MKLLKNILKWSGYILLIPITYIIVSVILTAVTTEREIKNQVSDKTIYLSTNGVHLDIVVPKKNMDSMLLSGLKHNNTDTYFSFGWGDENFYINTPNWSDLTFSNAFRAMFLKSETLMHVTRYENKRSDWVEVQVSSVELQKLNTYLQDTFKTNQNGMKIILENQGYTTTDDFYKSKGSYSCFKTCNSWVNSGFKESGLKACLWTPFDYGLMNKYDE